MKSFDPLTPASLAKLLSFMEEHAFVLVAGGTDIFARSGWTQSLKIPHGASLIDLSGVKEMRGIHVSGDELRIGALETMTAVSEDENVRRFAHGLATAASRIGSWQIRNRATLGGNLANASPAADTPPALASLDAHVTLASPRGSRELPVALVPDGPNHSTLARDEVVVRFSIPLKPKRASSFGKIGLRSEVSIARLNLAASVAVNRTSKKKPPEISDPLVFVGTLGTAVRRCFGAEAALAHRPLDDAAAFCNALAAVVEKAIPGRATLPYKRSAIRALGEDVLAALCKEVGTLS